MNRRNLPKDRVKYPMLIGRELYDKVKEVAGASNVSIAAIIDNSIKQYLAGDKKDKEINQLNREISLLRPQIGKGRDAKALAEAVRARVHAEGLLEKATDRLSEIEGYFNQ